MIDIEKFLERLNDKIEEFKVVKNEDGFKVEAGINDDRKEQIIIMYMFYCVIHLLHNKGFKKSLKEDKDSVVVISSMLKYITEYILKELV